MPPHSLRSRLSSCGCMRVPGVEFWVHREGEVQTRRPIGDDHLHCACVSSFVSLCSWRTLCCCGSIEESRGFQEMERMKGARAISELQLALHKGETVGLDFVFHFPIVVLLHLQFVM